MLMKNSINAPAVNKSIIRRETIMKKLEPARERRLTLVSAPAGYGKTTAVFDWLNHCGLPAVWVSLNEYNNAPFSLWIGVCNALDDVIPGIKRNSEYILKSPEFLDANIQINLLTDAICAAKLDFALILDDVHLISDTSTLKGLSHFIDYLPANLHLLLISRTEPALELPKYRIKWQMQTIDEEDLRFQKDDIFRFYLARGLQLETDEVERLEQYTEGWAASLVAIAMTLEKDNKRRITPDSLPALSGSIDRYLRDDVISSWTEEKWNFAMKTSVLDTLSEEVCNAVTGQEKAGRLLAELYKDNGFLSALDESGKKYRFHRLFREFASKCLMDDEPALVSQLHARAGFWYKENGSFEIAVEYFFKAGLYEEVLEIIEKENVLYIYNNRTQFSWVERLPDCLRENSFKCANIFAMCFADIERYDLAHVWTNRMKALAAMPEYSSTPEIAAYCAIACALSETYLFIREGNPLFMQPFMSAAEQYDPGNYKTPEFFDFNTSDIYCYRCPISLLIRFRGERKDDFQVFAGRYREIIVTKPGYKALVEGEYLYENDKLNEALPYLLDAMEEARSASCMGALVPTMADLARIRRVAGDFEGAYKTLDECEKILQESGKLHWSYIISALRCRFFIDKGDVAKVDDWLSSCKLDIYAEISRIREFELIVYARALIFKDRVQDAELLLSRLLAFTEKTNRPHSRVEILNMLASLAYQSGKKLEACAYLDCTLTMGREQGYVRSYLDEGKAMAKLLAVYSKGRPDVANADNAGFAASLLQQIRKEQASEPLRGGLPDCLSPREREVLTLLLEANSNREISEQMGITLQAVKYHVGNIYGKLGVKSRVQCLALVRESSAKRD